MTDIKHEEPKKTMGRPKVWTDEKIDDYGDRLIKWAEKTDSFALIQFCAQENMVPSKIGNIARENENFRAALMITKAKLASRMIRKLNSKEGGCHPVFFNKYIRVNDWLLDQHLKEVENTEVTELTKRVVKIIDFSSLKKERDEKLKDMIDIKNDEE